MQLEQDRTAGQGCRVGALGLGQVGDGLGHIDAGDFGQGLLVRTLDIAGGGSGGIQSGLGHAVIADLVDDIVFVVSQGGRIGLGNGAGVSAGEILLERDQVIEKIRAVPAIDQESTRPGAGGIGSGGVDRNG